MSDPTSFPPSMDLPPQQRDAHLWRELLLLMQSSQDPAELQEAVLRGLVHDLGYTRAAVGLYDGHGNALSGWLVLDAAEPIDGQSLPTHTMSLSLQDDTGPLAQALHENRVVELWAGEPLLHSGQGQTLLRGRHYLILPLHLRENPVGVILVDELPPEEALPETKRASLRMLALHAAIALGSLRLCLDRAQRTAVIEERNRIALELHDNVSQTLYGLSYGLEACLHQLEPGSVVHQMLEKLHQNAADMQTQMRSLIFDMRSRQITADAFVSRLHRHVRAVSPVQTMALQIDLPGDFNQWPESLRDRLYQIAQEALANAARHANPSQIVIRLSRRAGQIELRVADDGEGFDQSEVDPDAHLGIQAMQARAHALGGNLDISSDLGEGTLVQVQVPVNQLSSPLDSIEDA